MTSDQRRGVWLNVAGIVGILVAVGLTAAIWFEVIDRQATAVPRREERVSGTPGPSGASDAYEVVDDAGTPSPMP